MGFRFGLVSGLSIAVIALACVGILSYRRTSEEDEDQQWVSHTHLVLETLAAIEADLIDAETGERGFVISGDDSYLRPYKDGVDRLQNDLKAARSLTNDNPHQQHALDQVEFLVTARLAQFSRVLAARQEKGLGAGIAAVTQGHGKETMDTIRVLVGNMRDEEHRLLDQRLEHTRLASKRTKEMAVFGNAVALAFLIISGLIIFREMNRRYRADDRVRKINTQLETANKELEAFSYSVSHDLRAPLRAIDGFSLALLEDSDSSLDLQGKNHLQRIRAGTAKMGQLIDGMLTLARISRVALVREEVDLATLARDILSSLKESEPDRRVDFRFPAQLLAQGDRVLLRALLENLLNNAWKFTSQKPSAFIEIGNQNGAKESVYFVRDNGAGFDMAYAQRLFGVFHRLHREDEFPGTGVGLATVQRIVHRHGGRIWAEAAPEKGATFYFVLGS